MRIHHDKKLNRSAGGNAAMIVLLSVFGLFSVLPVLLSVFQSFKPMNELFLYLSLIHISEPTRH